MGEALVGDEADAPAAEAGSQGLAERGVEAAEVGRVAEAGAVGRVDDDEVGRAFRPLKVADRGSGFAAGLGVIAGNPKTILSYAGVLPGFFDFRTLPVLDMAVICLISAAVPFIGNLAWAALFARARRWLADPVAMRWTHVGAGSAVGAVGVAIAVIRTPAPREFPEIQSARLPL